MQALQKQFIGRTTWRTLAGLSVALIIAILFRDTAFEPAILLLFGISLFFLTVKSLETGLLIAFAEMFTGGHGHLLRMDLSGFTFSLRMMIFGIIFLAFIWLLWKKKIRYSFLPSRDYPVIAVILAICVGTLIGFLHQDTRSVFDDANSYAAILYLFPLMAIEWNAFKRRRLLQVLFASALWTAFLTILLSFAFTHFPLGISGEIYTFVRDSRLAEVTLQVATEESAPWIQEWMPRLLGERAYWYRIFLPTQFFVLVLTLLSLSAGATIMKREKGKGEWYLIPAICLAALYLGGSRSFLVGMIAALGILAMILLFIEKWRPFDIIRLSTRSMAVLILAFLFAWGSVALPYPIRPDIKDAAFYKTSADTERSAAVASRWALLTPLMDKILSSPVTGRGFGATVVYKSEDPRIIAETGGGIYETYRFEWGYHDIWLKMGVLGLFSFAWLAFAILKAGFLTLKVHKSRFITLGLLSGFIALLATHIFSPYLNHPIGISYLLFIIPFLDFTLKQAKDRTGVQESIVKKRLSPLPKPVVTSDRSFILPNE